MKIIVIVDMQKDFISKALKNDEAEAMIPRMQEVLTDMNSSDNIVLFTKDTHYDDYMNTQEGKYLPVPHCIRGSEGWQIRPELAALLEGAQIYEKPTFGSTQLAADLKAAAEKEEIELELIGLCTDICVVSNALLLKAAMPSNMRQNAYPCSLQTAGNNSDSSMRSFSPPKPL